MARVTTATAKKADKKCGKCGRVIEKGETYTWAMPGFRSSWKSRKIRCTDHPFRRSDLTTSLRGDAYAAIESAEDELNGMDPATVDEDAGDIEQIISQVADSIHEVASAYEEAAESFGGGGPNGEAKEEMEAAADELEGFSTDAFGDEYCEVHQSEELPYNDGKGTIDTAEALDEARAQCDECQDFKIVWAQDQINNALGALADLSI